MDIDLLNKLVQSYVLTIKRQGIPVSSAYIFGSYAKGTAVGKNSDIDVCIVSPLFGNDRVKDRVLLMRLREGISDLIEPHPISDEEINSRFDPFIREVKKTGIKIE